ncbi:hypothetical protein V1477_016430 [Vespula maculifrons]|uniref:Uncharacterized protein n=2 Tax=Vespula TaxID=7451 RepID=A0A834N969_VESVU|nr:hypothetical protein HZH66_006885 [Vespula vulgaris]
MSILVGRLTPEWQINNNTSNSIFGLSMRRRLPRSSLLGTPSFIDRDYMQTQDGSFDVHLIVNSFIFYLRGKDGLNRDITPPIEDERLHLNSNRPD